MEMSKAKRLRLSNDVSTKRKKLLVEATLDIAVLEGHRGKSSDAHMKCDA